MLQSSDELIVSDSRDRTDWMLHLDLIGPC